MRFVICKLRRLLDKKETVVSFKVPRDVPVKDYLYNKYGLKGYIIVDHKED